MNREEFIAKMQDALQSEEELTFDTVLDDIEEWDSISKMAVVAFFDASLGKKITFAELKELKTIGDIANKAGL